MSRAACIFFFFIIFFIFQSRGSSLSSGCMDVDVKSSLHPPCTRPAPPHCQSVHQLSLHLLHSLFLKTKMQCVQYAQTSAAHCECTTILHLVFKSASFASCLCKSTNWLVQYALREIARCIMHEQGLHCQCVQWSMTNIVSFAKGWQTNKQQMCTS